MEAMRSNQVFKEKEAVAVIRHALQMQAAASAASDPTLQGLTYEELKRIALEAGIGETFLAQAAERASLRNRSGFLNLVEETEKSVEGEPAIEDFAEQAQLLAYDNRYGEVSLRPGPSLKGSLRIANSSGGSVLYRGRRFSSHATVNLEDGFTRIRVRSSLAAAGFVGLSALSFGVVIGSLVSFLLTPESGLTTILTALGCGILLFGTLAFASILQARKLADSLAGCIGRMLSGAVDADSEVEPPETQKLPRLSVRG